MWPHDVLWPKQTSIFSSELWACVSVDCWLGVTNGAGMYNWATLGHNRPRRQTQKRNFIFIPFVLVQTVRGDVVKLFTICFSWCEVPLASWRPRERVRAGQSDGTAATIYCIYTSPAPASSQSRGNWHQKYFCISNKLLLLSSLAGRQSQSNQALCDQLHLNISTQHQMDIFHIFHLCCNSITAKPFILDVISELQRHTFCLTSL